VSDVLNRILDDKRKHVADCRSSTPLAEIEERAQNASPVRGFIQSLQNTHDRGDRALIAEIKKASPSKGLIRADFDPTNLAQAYEAAGASCLSVLTDVPYFQGHDDYLVAARAACALPVLRKDFMIDPFQVVEARALGADCILLIMAALSDALAKELEDAANALEMDVLIEVHDAAELERALLLKSPLLGVNNRNLKTLDVDTQVTIQLSSMVPADRILVSESGLYTSEDLSEMEAAGAKAFLIGESLMRQDDVEAATRAILSRPQFVHANHA